MLGVVEAMDDMPGILSMPEPGSWVVPQDPKADDLPSVTRMGSVQGPSRTHGCSTPTRWAWGPQPSLMQHNAEAQE